MAKRRTYVRDSRGRFASTGGTRRGKVAAGHRRAGRVTTVSTVAEASVKGRNVAVVPALQVSHPIYRSDRLTVSGHVSASRSPRLSLGAGLNASVSL